MGRIGESSGWGQSNILGNNGDKSPKDPQISKWDGDSVFGEFGHPFYSKHQKLALMD